MVRCAWCDAELTEPRNVFVLKEHPEPKPVFGSDGCYVLYKAAWKGKGVPEMFRRAKPHRCPHWAPTVVVANATIGRTYPAPKRPDLRPTGANRGQNFVTNLLKGT